MSIKLNSGDQFPAMPLTMVDGSELNLPGSSSANYQIILFYRGAF